MWPTYGQVAESVRCQHQYIYQRAECRDTCDARIEHAVFAEVLLEGGQPTRGPRPAICEGVAIHDHIIATLRSMVSKVYIRCKLLSGTSQHSAAVRASRNSQARCL